MKYVIVTGGVLSGLGKGVTTSSIGLLLKECGVKVTAIKIDPYLNCDAGTMNPFEHGEVFVLDDGSEVDLDLGNYERFLDIDLSGDHNITTGKVYRSVIEKERRGDYLGKTVQIVPHIVREIKRQIRHAAEGSGADVALVEMGGTVGDIESMPFLEAARQMRRELGPENLVFVHTTLVPVMGVVGEQKTKPTQHSVKELRALGLQPDIIVARGFQPLQRSTVKKISLFCDVAPEAVFSAHDVENVYQVPLLLDRQGMTSFVMGRLGFAQNGYDLAAWKHFVDKFSKAERSVRIALVGKYTGLKDSYLSHLKAFNHSGAKLGCKVEIEWVEAPGEEPGTISGSVSENFERDCKQMETCLADMDAVIIPGGFGVRGTEGKLRAARFARERRLPFLGVCLGFQVMVIEFARNVMQLSRANSSELDPATPHPVVDLMPEQRDVTDKGATMRLGTWPAVLREGSLARRLYGRSEVSERHRHRYEVNPDYIGRLEGAGLVFSGRSPDGQLMEVAELSGHPFFIASQFHPEFRSRPAAPAPLHLGLVKAAMEYAQTR